MAARSNKSQCRLNLVDVWPRRAKHDMGRVGYSGGFKLRVAAEEF
jgi:hypothetical protein